MHLQSGGKIRSAIGPAIMVSRPPPSRRWGRWRGWRFRFPFGEPHLARGQLIPWFTGGTCFRGWVWYRCLLVSDPETPPPGTYRPCCGGQYSYQSLQSCSRPSECRVDAGSPTKAYAAEGPEARALRIPSRLDDGAASRPAPSRMGFEPRPYTVSRNEKGGP